MKNFDPLATPLEGLNLIEASAGTGKTYAISNLYLQLLLEKNLTAEEILVVTFTKAATEELKGRIRGRIVDAISSFSGFDTGDEFLTGLVKKISNGERSKRILINALQSFDLAAIFTIHGFCLRMLYSHAFESASLFDTGLVEDQTKVLSEIVDDFWRLNFYSMEPHLFTAIAHEMTRGKLLDLAKKCVSNPFLVIDAGSSSEDNGGMPPDSTGSSIVSLRQQFIDYVRRESARRKGKENVRSYDDLLIDFLQALEGPGGKALAHSIRSHYRAALVDEFQDTDPLQYKIFRIIYGEGEGTIFFIGDPKQSIYSFRGADIFSYIEAANDVKNQYTLGKNWRSSEGLIKAVNTIFGESVNPFIFESLTFHPVERGDQDEAGVFTIGGVQDQSPLKIWFMKREQDKKNITKGVAQQLVGQAVADEIIALLTKGAEGMACVDGRPIHAGDIAILVAKNRQAREILKVLNDSHIPGVIYSAENIFVSHEAMEIERLLSAVLEPANEVYVKSALTTDMLGLSGNDLAELAANDKAWDGWVVKFETYRSLFLSQGFIAMARELLTREGVKQRLRSFPDGERRVTNVLHCVELLHGASIEEKLGTEGLLKWLREKRVKEKISEADEYQIRLETDEKAVKIVTIHKSKGLEYPVVFCPFPWDSAEVGRDKIIVYHDKDKANKQTMDIGFPTREKAWSCKEHEDLAEKVRLLYVALTRARYRCYLTWGPINKSETSALAYLLHHPFRQQEPLSLAAMKEFMKGLDDEQMIQDIKRLEGISEGSMELIFLQKSERLTYEPPQPDSARLECRQFKGAIEKNWLTTSFSALISGRDQYAETPDRDKETGDVSLQEELKPAEPERKRSSMFDFPRGARAGTCLHEIFEHIDFSLADPDEARRFIGEKLAAHGFEHRWLDAVYTTVENVLAMPLVGGGNPFTLSTLKPVERLHEVEFYAPLELISPDRIGRIFRSQSSKMNTKVFADLIESLGFAPHKGMLRGFIDMVFHHDGKYYLVDWKSNFLGETIEDYKSENLIRVMEKELYILQYHIYTVALHRFLGVRVKEYDYHKHFGGVLYLFLRGIDPSKGPGYGIFFDKPELKLTDELAHCLTGRVGK